MRVVTKYYEFGVLLLDDEEADEVDKICETCQSNKDRAQKILKVWTKEKKGLPVTWENLIETLRECGIMDLARTLEDAKIRGSYSYTY